jgi:hypothetical protein
MVNPVLHQSNNIKKTYITSWLNGRISINCQDVNVIHVRSETSRCQYIKHNQYLNVMICLTAITWKYEDSQINSTIIYIMGQSFPVGISYYYLLPLAI